MEKGNNKYKRPKKEIQRVAQDNVFDIQVIYIEFNEGGLEILFQPKVIQRT